MKLTQQRKKREESWNKSSLKFTKINQLKFNFLLGLRMVTIVILLLKYIDTEVTMEFLVIWYLLKIWLHISLKIQL